MFDEINRPDHTEDEDENDPHWKIVKAALFAMALLAVGYVMLSRWGRLVGVIGGVVLTLAAFAAYQWVSVWLNARKQERGPEADDDGAPITLNLRSSDKDDGWR